LYGCRVTSAQAAAWQLENIPGAWGNDFEGMPLANITKNKNWKLKLVAAQQYDAPHILLLVLKKGCTHISPWK